MQFPADFVRLFELRSSYGHLYRRQPNVRNVVDFLATEVASVKLKLYERVPTSSTLPTGRLELDEHDMQTVLNFPSPFTTRSRLWFGTAADYHVYNVAYWLKVRVGGQVKALVRVPPPALVPQRDVLRRITHYTTALGGRIELSDLVVFHGYDPELQEGSVSPIETLRATLAEDIAAQTHRRRVWSNATRKDGIVERPVEAPEWDYEAREAWRADFEAIMSGADNAGKVALLEDGMRWVEAAWNAREMEYLSARKLTREESSAAWRVDPRLVFASPEKVDAETRTGFYVDRLVPLLTQFQEEIDLQLMPDFEPFDAKHRMYTQFNIDEKMRGSFEQMAQIASTAVGGPVATVNEWRARLNLPPIDDGDKIFIPLNSIRAGGPQSGPQGPVATPGPAPAPGETPGGGTRNPLAPPETPKAREDMVWALAAGFAPDQAAWLANSLLKYSPDQPRDERGRFGDSGGHDATYGGDAREHSHAGDMGAHTLEHAGGVTWSRTSGTAGSGSSYPGDTIYTAEANGYTLESYGNDREGYNWKIESAMTSRSWGSTVRSGHEAEARAAREAAVRAANALPHETELEQKSKARVAADELHALITRVTSERAAELKAFFDRQRRSVKSAGGKFALPRWNKELGEDLTKMAVETSGLFGMLAAKKIGAKYDVERTRAYWEKASAATAETLNTATGLALATQDPDAVFDALDSRVEAIARGQVNRQANWAVVECARQAGAV